MVSRDSKGRFVKNTNGKSNGVVNLTPLDQVFNNQRLDLLNHVEQLWNGATLYQRKILTMFMDPRRDINRECGLPDTEELSAENYKELYDREPLAARVVDIYPRECWQTNPMLFETEELDNITPFEQAFEDMNRNLLGPGFFEGQDSKPFWEYLERADKLSGIGLYGGVLLGIDDGLELSEPAELNREGFPTAKRKLLYMKSMDELTCQIATWEEDTKSPRYGMPNSYNVRFRRTESRASTRLRSSGRVSELGKSKEVHWSRIVHLADNLETSDVEGVPRLQVQYNRLYALFMLYAGSAEMYWKGALPGLVYNQSADAAELTEAEKDKLRDRMEQFQNSLQRILSARNGSFSMLAPTVVDPRSHIDAQIEALCIHIGVPKRIFMGSERGELASSQDERDWLKKVKKRQVTYCTPRIIVPAVDRLILMGVLPKPKATYNVKWGDIASLTDMEKADLAVKRMDAMTKYVGGNVESIMVPHDFYVRELGMDPEEADEILDNAIQALEERESEEAEAAEQEHQKQLELAEAGGQQAPGTGEEAQQEAEGEEEEAPFPNNAFCPTGNQQT